MTWRQLLQSRSVDFDPEKKYTDRELEELADELLRAQAREVDPKSGKERGIGGLDPILFEEHIYSRKRREIYPENGTPDPALVSGSYNKSHPEGRKINSPEARRRHGASYYK